LQAIITLGAGAGPIGIAVAAFIGTAIGTSFGNLFGGGEDNPSAWAGIAYDYDNQEFYVAGNWDHNGGDASVALSFAEQAVQGINEIIEITHGKLRSGAVAPRIQIGYEGNSYLVAVDGGSFQSFSTAGDAISHAAYELMTGFDLVGGHAVPIFMNCWRISR
jgi:hypothetical protein